MRVPVSADLAAQHNESAKCFIKYTLSTKARRDIMVSTTTQQRRIGQKRLRQWGYAPVVLSGFGPQTKILLDDLYRAA